jgi:flagellar biosynthesis/type III secretory pathway protein FliH
MLTFALEAAANMSCAPGESKEGEEERKEGRKQGRKEGRKQGRKEGRKRLDVRQASRA